MSVVALKPPHPSRKRTSALAPLIALALGASLLSGIRASTESSIAAQPAIAPAISPQTQAATDALESLPLSFIANEGQTDPRVEYMLQGTGASLYFTRDGATWRVSDGSQAWAVEQVFVGAAATKPVGIDEQKTSFSWYKGAPDAWVQGAAAYSGVRYNDLWPGIDLVYYDKGGALEYRFVVQPGADPSKIEVAYRGAELSVLPAGELQAATPVKDLVEMAPVAYQGATQVAARFRVSSDAYTFGLGHYDHSRVLVVDPTSLTYAGYVGGTSSPGLGTDNGYGIAVDSSGAAYITGITESSQASFPETVGPDLTYAAGYDAFVAKVAPSGASLTYAGYIGGAGSDEGYGIAVDSSGAAYIAGSTTSGEATFPISGGPDLTYAGDAGLWGDAFVAKVAPSGASLTYAGYFGASGNDKAQAIAVDTSGAAYITGLTNSSVGLPFAGGLDSTWNFGNYDAFVAKIAPSGASVSYGGFIGGSGIDSGNGIAVDTSGAAYVAGSTSSDQTTFPVSAGPDLTFNDASCFLCGDAFVAKVDPSGDSLAYTGYIGGALEDYGHAIAVDSAGAAYITGSTESLETSFPVSGGPDLSQNGDFDAFVAKVGTSGASLTYAGYVGGDSFDEGKGVAVHSDGTAFITGTTFSTQATFPVASGPDLTFNDDGVESDAFVTKVGASGGSLPYSGYIGGASGEGSMGIAVDAAGAAYVTGYTVSDQTSFPVVGGPDLTFNGEVDLVSDAFVAKVTTTVPGGEPAITSADSATFTVGVAGTFTVTTTGTPDAGISKTGGLPSGVSLTDNGDGTATLAGTPGVGTAGSYPITLTATNGVLPDDTQNFTLTVDAAGATFRPDALIKYVTSATYLGNDIYNTTTTGQAVSQKVGEGKTRTFDIKIANDASVTDTMQVQGCASANGLLATYKEGVLNVTSQVVGGTFETDALAPGGEHAITLTIKARANAKSGKKLNCKVTATSLGDDLIMDAVLAKVTVR